MNILIVTPGFPSNKNNSFSAKFVLHEALAFSKNNANVKVITPHYPGVDTREIFHDNIEVLRFRYFLPESMQKIVDPVENIYDRKPFVAIIQIPIFIVVYIVMILRYSFWADIIHCQWTISALLALPSKYIVGKKIVVTARGSDLRLFPKWLNRLIHKRVDAAVDCFGPQKWNNEYKKNFPANYIRLPLILESNPPKEMPRDSETILRGKENIFRVIYLGRFDPLKIRSGFPIVALIHAAKGLKKELKNDKKFHIYYIGDGDITITSEMKKLVKKYSLTDCISFLGPKDNVNDYLPYCDLGVGGTAFNAVSCEFSYLKKPQLMAEGSDNIGTPWKDKENTIFFRVGDTDSLVSAILYAIEDKKRLSNIGENAYRMISKYAMNIENGGEKYVQAFTKIINSSK